MGEPTIREVLNQVLQLGQQVQNLSAQLQAADAEIARLRNAGGGKGDNA